MPIMTRINRLSIATAVAAALAVTAAGCNNDKLTEINQNPNAPVSVPAPTIFTNAVQTAVGTWLGSAYDLRDIELLVQHLAENQYIGNDQYKGVGPSALS